MLGKLGKLVKFLGKSVNLPEESLFHGTSEYLAFLKKISWFKLDSHFNVKNSVIKSSGTGAIGLKICPILV